MKKGTLAVFLCFTLLLMSSIAGASVTMTNDRTSFEALSTIAYNYGFDDFSTHPDYLGQGYVLPGEPWTSHGVTYTSAQNLIGWHNYGYYTNGTPMMCNNYWNPVTGTIDQTGQYSRFGFDAGYGNYDDSGAVITVTTNLNSYAFNVDLNRADNTLFYGFVAGSGEYFTGFDITTNERYALASMDNVTLGSAVPLPATVLLFGPGLAGLAYFRKRILKK